MLHVGREDMLFDKMINHVQRQRQICAKQLMRVRKCSGIVKIKAFGVVTGETLLAVLGSRSRDVQAEVPGIFCQLQLVTIPNTKLDDGADAVVLHKLVDEFSLEFSQPAIEPSSRDQPNSYTSPVSSPYSHVITKQQ